MPIQNIVSVSGGKDSTATLLVAIALETENIQAVFADTGNEHEQTYAYLDYLQDATGIPIRRVQADFTRQIAGRRLFVETKWREQGVDENLVLAAIDMLQPTGNPFLDLCIWKGRFPSRMAQFCTMELKRDPMLEQVILPLIEEGGMILSWQGVRADESLNRKYLPECDEVGGGLFNYRPILKWDVAAVFEAHRYMGIKPNPLYSQGMSRVGCMPCINCSKEELRAIALRFPEVIERIASWEQAVARAAKRGAASFFTVKNLSTKGLSAMQVMDLANIRATVEWSKTTRGGNQYDLMIATDAKACTSAYGLCE